jgi:hypothetical protein
VRVVSDGQPPRADPEAQTPGATSARKKGNPARAFRRVGISSLDQGKEKKARNMRRRGGVDEAGKKVVKALLSVSSGPSR